MVEIGHNKKNRNKVEKMAMFESLIHSIKSLIDEEIEIIDKI